MREGVTLRACVPVVYSFNSMRGLHYVGPNIKIGLAKLKLTTDIVASVSDNQNPAKDNSETVAHASRWQRSPMFQRSYTDFP